MDLRVLGPLDVGINGATLRLGAPKQQSVLALLAVHANRVVGVDELVDELWPDRPPPASAVANIRSYAATLRRLFHAAEGACDRIVRCGTGYRLRADPAELDLLAFTEECRRGRTEIEHENPSTAVALLSGALARWRGPMLAGLPRGTTLAAKCAALEAERLSVTEQLLELHLAMGKPEAAVPALQELVRMHPLREHAHALLMLALEQVGDTAGALSAYTAIRRALVEELGVEPGPELQHIHRAVLNRDPGLNREPGLPDRRRDSLANPPDVPARPRELPPDLGYFAGRREEIVQITGALTGGHDDRRRPAVVILSGSGGVGKSALAVHVGHTVADRYADGQLYVDLQGSSPGLSPLTPVDALRRLLRSLGYPQDQIPADEAAAAGRLRTATADGSFLLVLDNARDAHQVVPLLPSSGRCGVIVTARQQLATLDADAHLTLGSFQPAEALALLTHMVGDQMLEGSTAETLVSLCENLPLAVRIVAGRLLSRPDLSPGELMRRLMDRERRLDELELEGVAVRSCIRVGYDAVASGDGRSDRLAAQAFRALGLLNVPDIQPAVMAAMLAEPDLDRIESALNRLVAAQLLTANGPRYRLHDLVRLVAAERSADEDDPDSAERILYRGLAYYAAALRRAGEMLRPERTWIPPSLDALAGITSVDFRESADALSWIEAELSNAVAAAEQASRHNGDLGRLALSLVGTIQPNLYARNDWHTQHMLAGLAVAVGASSPDPEERGWVHFVAGRSEADRGNGAEALDHFHRGLPLLKQAGSLRGVGLVLNALGIVAMNHARDPDLAMKHFTECLELSRRHRLAAHEANILHNLGNLCITIGNWDAARDHLERSMRIWRQRGDNEGLARALAILSVIHCAQDRHEEATACGAEAASRARSIGNPLRECLALLVVSEVHRRQEEYDRSRSEADAALALARDSAYRYGEAAALRQKLKVARSTGRHASASALRAEADAAFARLPTTLDPVYESVLAAH